MATQPLSPRGLQLQMEEKANETIVHCKGKITAENSETFQREIRDLIPESRGQIAAITHRIVLDLSNVQNPGEIIRNVGARIYWNLAHTSQPG